MTDIDRVYRLTAVRAPELADIKGLDRSFFEELETITEITNIRAAPGDPEGQRIQFKVEKHRRTTPNQAEVTITNLSPVSRDEFVKGPTKIRLEAGYDNAPRLLFLGDLRYASNEHDGTEWLTKLQLGDGARAFREARINRSYGKGTPVSTIVKDLAKAFGVPAPAEVLASSELQSRISTGEVVSGPVNDELTRILLQFGFEWSFQNGRLQVVRFDEAIASSIRVISQDDGMIGAPVIDPPKIRMPSKKPSKKPRVPKLTVKHTLYPELVPGEKIEVVSASINGTFIIDNLTHEGDSFGDDWMTTIEAVSA